MTLSDAGDSARAWSRAEPQRLASRAAAPAAPPPPAAPVDAGAELEAARRRGYDAGFAEGLAAGRAQAESVAAQMQALLDAMAAPFRDSDAVLLRELLDLTEQVCRAVIGRELRSGVDIEALLREALAALGASAVPVELSLHPDDAALCRDSGVLPDERYQVVETTAVERGGLQLRAGARFVDASVEARIEAALAALRAEAGVPLDDAPAKTAPPPPPAAGGDEPAPE